MRKQVRGEIISGESILLPPELVFSGDALGCLTCYASSDEDQTDRGAPAASAAQAPAPPGVTAWSDPTDEQAVRQLISAEMKRIPERFECSHSIFTAQLRALMQSMHGSIQAIQG